MEFDLKELRTRAQILLAQLEFSDEDLLTQHSSTSDELEFETCSQLSEDQMQRDTELAEFMSAQYDLEARNLPLPSTPPPRYSEVMAERDAPQEPLLESEVRDLEAWDADRIAAYQGISRDPDSTGSSQTWSAGGSHEGARTSEVPQLRRPIRAKKHEKALQWLAGRRPLGRP